MAELDMPLIRSLHEDSKVNASRGVIYTTPPNVYLPNHLSPTNFVTGIKVKMS